MYATLRCLFIALVLSNLTGCFIASRAYDNRPYTDFSYFQDHTIAASEGGFTLSMRYDRYVLLPGEAERVRDECVRFGSGLAYAHAKRPIKPLYETLRVDVFRSAWTGIATCKFTATAHYL